MSHDSYGFFAFYAGVPGADIDLQAASAQASASTVPQNAVARPGTACAAIRCGTAGNLVLIPERGGASVSVPFAAGETVRLRASKIVAAGTTAGAVTVFWSE